MNYIPQIAKMLGVEIGEEFIIRHKILKDESTFVFLPSGFKCLDEERYAYHPDSDWLLMVLSDKAEIIKKPWKPNQGEAYWYIEYVNGVGLSGFSSVWRRSVDDYMRYRIGNCYLTQDEAEADREKWQRFMKDERIAWE